MVIEELTRKLDYGDWEVCVVDGELSVHSPSMKKTIGLMVEKVEVVTPELLDDWRKLIDFVVENKKDLSLLNI